MVDHVRWGVLGAANFARNHMARAIHAAEGGAFSALATSRAEKAAGFKAFAPDLKIYDSYDALLADPDIDAVYIPLPNHLHVPWALRAAEAGKAVLCEKPIALEAGDIDRLIEARERTGMLIAEAWMIAHHPQWQKAKALIDDGAIGSLRRVQGNFSYFNDDTSNIRNQADTGGGALPDIGVYILGGARLATGCEPDEILSVDIEWDKGVDVSAYVTAQFPGFIYQGYVSMRAAPWQEMQFHGTEGLIRIPVPFNANVYGEARVELHRGQEVTEWRFPADNHYVAQVEAFNRSVLTGQDYPVSLEFAQGTQRMMDMIYSKGSTKVS